MKFLRPTDGITMNRDRLLADAKARALKMLAAGYKPPKPPELRLPGPSGRTGLNLVVDGFAQQGKALPHDVAVSDALAEVLTGGKTDYTEIVTEDHVTKLESAAFMKLVKTEPRWRAWKHMLTTGKPLRN